VEWAKEMAIRSKRLDEESRRAFAPLLAKAADAARRNDDATVREVRDRVSTWGLSILSGELEKALTVTPPPPPPSAASASPALVKAFLAARGRDFEAAAKEAADPADQEALRLAAQVPLEASSILAKWPRGWNLAVTVFDAGGTPLAVDEPVLRVEPYRADVRRDRGTQGIEFGEITAASLADLFRNRTPKKDTDARAAAWFCAIEGDIDAARRHWPEVPERALAAALKAAESANVARENEARALFADAEGEFRRSGSRATSLPKFQRLLSEFADTAFVKRNRLSIQARSDGGREYFFAPDDLSGSGLFKPQRQPDGRVAWTMEEDDKSKKLDAAVELEFGALADAEFRMWIFAGACCQETFAFSVQATDLAGSEPGGPGSTPVPASLPFLKRTHALHGGRKEPTRWDWIPVPIPGKYAVPGPKKVRLVGEQQGFSIAYALVSSTRKAPPKEAEVKELERGRTSLALRGIGSAGAVTGSILREWWLGIPGADVSALLASPAYPHKPSGSELVTLLEGPTNWGDNYGTRIRGYLHPPQNGAYTFWATADDSCDVYLSLSDDPVQKQRIASVPSATQRRNWDAGQKAGPIQLFRGKRYYIEVLHKEAIADDHVAVGWQLPDGTLERPIPGKRLSPWTGASRTPGVLFQSLAAGALPAPAKIDLAGEVFGGIVPQRAEVFNASTRLGEAKAATLSYTWSAAPAGAWPLFLRVTDKSGAVYTSPAVLARVGDIFFYRGINLNGPGLSIDGNPWEGREAPNLAVKGAGFEFPDAELKPPADAERGAMIRSSVTSPEGTSVTLKAVPAGTYQVYLYLWGEGEPKTFDLLLKGKVVHPAYQSAAGKWDRLGPWTVDVADGQIEIKASKGGACFSGIEVWSVGVPLVAPTVLTPTPLVGGTGGSPFEERPSGPRFLVGFRYSLTTYLKSAQGIYLSGEERKLGELSGDPEGKTLEEIVAKPGYAVGGLIARGTQRVDQMKIIFMRISGPRLIPGDSYESPWIGAGGSRDEVKLVGDGSPVVGLVGRRGGDVDALGLLYLK
jgi:hypothetical protein